MPFVSVPLNTWTNIVTTDGKTIVENRGSDSVFLTTQASTGSLAADEGMELIPGMALIFESGVTVKANTPFVGGRVLWDKYG